MHKLMAFALLTLGVAGLSSCGPNHPRITQEELVRREQAMMDAIVPGDQTPWKEYLGDDLIYFDEKGRLHDKNSLVNDVSPMPKGYSGKIRVINPKSHVDGNVAIISYDSDESETIFGQELHARYHTTDTWMFRNGKWQIVAGQVLRYYEDPNVGKADVKMFGDYVGNYELAPGVTRSVTKEGNELYSKRGERPKELLQTETNDLFFRKGVEGRILFHRDEHGKVDTLIDRRNNEDVVWKKIG